MDMSATYKSTYDLCFPQAYLVYDHFHVKRLILDGINEVWLEEQGRRAARSRTAGRKLLMIPESG